MSAAAVPYSFSPATTIYSSQVNANFSALETAINNITAAPSGVYASDIVPTNSVQATFGGSQTYVFPDGIIVAGEVIATTVVSTGTSTTYAWCPPVFTTAGNATAASEHVVRGTVTITITNGVSTGNQTITLTGAAIFTSASSYLVFPVINQGASTISGLTQITTPVVQSSGSSFTVYVDSATNSAGTSTVVVNFFVSGD